MTNRTMSKLSKLYELRRLSQEFGMEWTEKQENQLEAEEERLIKNEVLPVVTKSIEPALSQVERELVLMVDYVPGSPLKVSLSRKRNLLDALEDVIEIKPDPVATHKTLGPQKKPKSNVSEKTVLRVTLPTGEVIAEKKAKDTFVKTIQWIGVMKSRSVGLTWCNVPLISNTEDPKYKKAQVDVGEGWLLLTHSSTYHKKMQLDKIAKALGIDLKVEIIQH